MIPLVGSFSVRVTHLACPSSDVEYVCNKRPAVNSFTGKHFLGISFPLACFYFSTLASVFLKIYNINTQLNSISVLQT